MTTCLPLASFSELRLLVRQVTDFVIRIFALTETLTLVLFQMLIPAQSLCGGSNAWRADMLTKRCSHHPHRGEGIELNSTERHIHLVQSLGSGSFSLSRAGADLVGFHHGSQDVQDRPAAQLCR
jgi:hypothetical protein